MGGVCDKIFECINRHPTAFVMIGGDCNNCMLENDLLYSLSSGQEFKLIKYSKTPKSRKRQNPD